MDNGAANSSTTNFGQFRYSLISTITGVSTGNPSATQEPLRSSLDAAQSTSEIHQEARDAPLRRQSETQNFVEQHVRNCRDAHGWLKVSISMHRIVEGQVRRFLVWARCLTSKGDTSPRFGDKDTTRLIHEGMKQASAREICMFWPRSHTRTR